jgi:hypothetical protein
MSPVAAKKLEILLAPRGAIREKRVSKAAAVLSAVGRGRWNVVAN